MREKLNAILVALFVAISGNALELTVESNPKLPIKNMAEECGRNFDFANGLQNWQCQGGLAKNPVTVHKVPKVGNAIKVTKSNAQLWRSVPVGKFKKGTVYIGSCMIQSDDKLPFKPFDWGGAGFTIVFFRADWKKSLAMPVRGRADKYWRTITSKPFTVPEWAAYCQLFTGLIYEAKRAVNLGCMVANISFHEAWTMLKVSAKSKEPIRQIRILNASSEKIFDSGIIKNKITSFDKAIKVEAAGYYDVMVVTDSGDVTKYRYPVETASTKSNTEQRE